MSQKQISQKEKVLLSYINHRFQLQYCNTLLYFFHQYQNLFSLKHKLCYYGIVINMYHPANIIYVCILCEVSKLLRELLLKKT